MFSGIVETRGLVVNIVDAPPGKKILVNAGIDKKDKIGDSVAINGCCLTVVEVSGANLAFDAGPETLRRTNLGQLISGSIINVERSLEVGSRLGGHFVSGHVDGTGRLHSRLDERDWSTYWFTCSSRLTRQMATKGSVAIDGVSLTVVDVEKDRFSVALIPHTLEVTTLGQISNGDVVNLETDLLAKYVQSQLLHNDLGN